MADPNPLPASRLILVKHSLPEIVPQVPAADWRLSPEGRARCAPLAGRLAVYDPAIIVTSREPKAVETGALVGAQLRLPCEPAVGLHEHERRGAGYLEPAAFAAAMRAFFAHPDQLVLGSETASQARARFAGAVAGVLARHLQRTVVIVAHGTVITLLLAEKAGIEPFSLWQRLGLPSFVVLTRPALAPVTFVERLS